MVSSAPCGRQQSARGRSMGQPRGGDNLTRFGQYAGDGGIRGGRYFALCEGPPPRQLGDKAKMALAFQPSSFEMRCTVPVPIPSDLATFNIPTPFASCSRTFRSVALSIFDRLSLTP